MYLLREFYVVLETIILTVVCVAVEFGLGLTTGLLYGFTFYNRNHHRGRRSIGD